MSSARPPLRTLVVDDEPLARSNLLSLLRLDPEIELLDECGSGEKALQCIREFKPDLLFLDIEMPECGGFDVLEMLGGNLPPAIVFVTAYDQYAVRAFEAGALDYLLKPFDNARFQLALARAKKRAHQFAGAPRPRPVLDFIALKAHGRLLFLKLVEIDWIEAADYYTCLHVGRAQHLLRRSLADLEADLDPNVFCRIHRSTIVRLDRVRGLKLNEGGEYDLELLDGTLLRISRSYRSEIQARLGIRS